MLATINGTELYYEVIGQGRPILFMHGGLGLDHTYFRPWLDPLADQYQLIFYDHSGNGRSPRSSFEGVTHATWADEADGLRAHLGLDKVILFGQSYGGFLAMEYALRHQDRLDGLVLLSTAPALDYFDVIIANAQKRGTPEQVAVVSNDLSRPAGSDEEWANIWRSIVSLYFHTYDPAIAADMDAKTHYSAGGFNHAFGHCLPVYNVVDGLPQITVPTFVMAGGDDWITPPTQAERIHRLILGSEIAIFEKSGHFPFVEEQTAYLAALRAWLDKLS
jgi:proline iminopeptidase